ncbi:anti-FecI sigma factor FecR [Haloferula helveola]|uniref:Anti-FecI sigma factor FecR n=2 Tax=Haloferula helveola TaxID=490095 RepID=A0ABM7RF29_9BACT|nr:anti-FecI sigma factor FecR [Haloferula helveola]
MSQDRERLDQLISKYLDNEATDEESAWLVARLGDSSADLDVMTDRLLIEAELLHLGAEGDLESREPARQPLWWRHPAWVSVAAAAALVMLVAGIMSLIATPDPEPFATWQSSPGSVISVTGGADEETHLSEGSTLRVSQGCAEVQLRDGVRCVVQAPSSLTLESEGRVLLKDGRARFHVEKQARGFTVMTPDLKVVDLGTEFGVDARGKDRGEVHVMTGLVEVTTRSGREATTRVSAGKAVAVALVGELEAIPFDAAPFLNELPGGIPAIRFPFDDREGDSFHGEGTIARRSGARFQLGGPHAPGVGDGRFGKALEFSGEHYIRSSWKGISGTQPRTVSFWVKIPSEVGTEPFPLVSWGQGRDPGAMSDFGIRLGGQGRIRIVSGRRWLEGGISIADGGWHHVAVIFGSYQRGSWPEAKLYIDSAEDRLIPGEPWRHEKASLDTFSTVIDHPWSVPVTLGRFGDDERTFLPELQGSIDELIIAEGVVTPKQVKALFENRLDESGLDLGR